MSAIDAFTAFIYSVFSNGRVGTWLSSGRESYENSIFVRGFNKLSAAFRKSEASDSVDLIMKKSRFAKATEAIRSYFANLSLGVYGLLLLVYGTASVFVYFIPILLGDSNSHGESALITSIIIAICAIPMTVSTRSFLTQVSESDFLKDIVLSFFAVPEEKLKSGKRLGGAVHMLISASLGLLLAGTTYFVHPAYIFAVFGVIAVFCLISANPESGVALTLVAVPFLQYVPFSEVFLAVMVLLTVSSYISKVMKRRRVFDFCLEELIVLIFCGFVFVSGSFSGGGLITFADSVFACVIIIGAFFTTYNLIRGKRLLNSFVNILGVSFTILAAIGLFNVFYDGVVDGVTYSIRDYVQPILEGNNLYIVDSAAVFSVLAILSFPMLLAFMAKQKKVKNIVGLLLISIIVISACFVYGTYETLIAILLEICIFWVLCSHKTFNVVIVMLLPIGFFAVLFPYLAAHVDIPAFLEKVSEFMPISFPEGAYHIEIGKSTVEILKDVGGIGAGDHAFKTAIEPYLSVASKGAEDSGSFWLQVACWSGFGGLVTLLLTLGLILKNSFGFLAVAKDKELRINALAVSCGLIGALIFGVINCLWNDARMLYLFWATVGVLAGYVREGRAVSDKNNSYLASESDSFDVELIFHK